MKILFQKKIIPTKARPIQMNPSSVVKIFWKVILKIYLDLVFGKLVCCKEMRGFEAEMPPWGFERDLETLPV